MAFTASTSKPYHTLVTGLRALHDSGSKPESEVAAREIDTTPAVGERLRASEGHILSGHPSISGQDQMLQSGRQYIHRRGVRRDDTPMREGAAHEQGQTTKCPFLELPAELRNWIYELVLTPSKLPGAETLSKSGFGVDLVNSQPPGQALLLSCRQIHREAKKMYLKAYREYWTTSRFFVEATDLRFERLFGFKDDDLARITHMQIQATYPGDLTRGHSSVTYRLQPNYHDAWKVSVSPGSLQANRLPYALDGTLWCYVTERLPRPIFVRCRVDAVRDKWKNRELPSVLSMKNQIRDIVESERRHHSSWDLAFGGPRSV